MGLLDNMKAKLGPAKEKVSDLAQRQRGSIEHGLDKAAKVVDEKTKGKYSEKIHAGTDKAKDAVDRIAHRGERRPDTATSTSTSTSTAPGGETAQTPPQTPPEGPPPTS